MIIQLFNRLENKLISLLASDLEAMLVQENKNLFNSSLKVVWFIFIGFVLAKSLYPSYIPIVFIIYFFILLGLFTICFKFKLYMISAVIGCLALTTVFIFEFMAFPLDKTLMEGTIVLIISSLLFYNRFVFLSWSAASLFLYMFGTIYIKWYKGSPFGIADINFLCIWMVVTGICWFFLRKTLELFDKFKMAQYALMIDPLTSVYNRAYLQDQIERFNHAEMLNKTLSILAIDLDHFKKINDTFGHPVGDKILVHFTEIIKKNIRSHDKIIRYGGEEFLVFMWHDGELCLQELSNRLCQAVRENQYVLENGIHIHTTCSIGVATLNPTLETIKECMERSNAALYEAKNSGRDRVVIDSATVTFIH